MSEFKGTKEEWRVDDNVIFADDYFQTHIAVVSAESYGTVINKANALLISKAPEMLEMLKELRGCVDWGYSSWGNDKGFIISEKLDNLIKQATEL